MRRGGAATDRRGRTDGGSGRVQRSVDVRVGILELVDIEGAGSNAGQCCSDDNRRAGSNDVPGVENLSPLGGSAPIRGSNGDGLIAPLKADDDEVSGQTWTNKRLRSCIHSSACAHGNLLDELYWRRRRGKGRSARHIGVETRIASGVRCKNPVAVGRRSKQTGVTVSGHSIQGRNLCKSGTARTLAAFHLISGYADVISGRRPGEIDLRTRSGSRSQIGGRRWRSRVRRNDDGKHRRYRVTQRTAGSRNRQTRVAYWRTSGCGYGHRCGARGSDRCGAEGSACTGGQSCRGETNRARKSRRRNDGNGVGRAVPGNHTLGRRRQSQRKIGRDGNNARSGAWVREPEVVRHRE